MAKFKIGDKVYIRKMNAKMMEERKTFQMNKKSTIGFVSYMYDYCGTYGTIEEIGISGYYKIRLYDGNHWNFCSNMISHKFTKRYAYVPKIITFSEYIMDHDPILDISDRKKYRFCETFDKLKEIHKITASSMKLSDIMKLIPGNRYELCIMINISEKSNKFIVIVDPYKGL